MTNEESSAATRSTIAVDPAWLIPIAPAHPRDPAGTAARRDRRRDGYGHRDANADRALAQRVTRFRAEVYREALARLGNPADAEDVCQQVLLEMHPAFASLGSPATPATQASSATRESPATIRMRVRRTMRFRCLDALRDRARWQWPRAPGVVESAHGERARSVTERVIDQLVIDERVIDQLDHAERLQVVLRGLARLSPAERDVLILRYAHELRHDEIGARVGVAADTSQMRISRALAALRVRVQRELSRSTPVLIGRPEIAKEAPRTAERRR